MPWVAGKCAHGPLSHSTFFILNTLSICSGIFSCHSYQQKQLMNARYLSGIISSKSMERVNNFLYVAKDKEFIKKWMRKLVDLNYAQLFLWQSLVKDSADIAISLPEHELNGFNFAYFIQSFIKNRIILAVPYFEQFCMVALQNNPALIANRYYVGNGGSPAFQMIVTYLVNRSINGSTQLIFTEVVEPLFRIIRSVMDNNLQLDIEWHLRRCLRSFYFNTAFTTKTEAIVDLVLKNLKTALSKDGNFAEKARVDYYPETFLEFFRSLFANYSGKFPYWNGQYRTGLTNQEYQNKYYPALKKMLGNIIVILDKNHKELVQCYREQISKALIEANRLENIIQLMFLPNFKELLFSQHFVCGVFANKNRKWCQFLWSCQEQREKICNMRVGEKNLLEVLCESRGLTHRLISLLWESGKFAHMPVIMNKKSRMIIEQQYGVGG